MYGNHGNYNSYNYVARRPVFVQPYYSFRPRFSLGFGIYAGYSVGYPYSYYDPYGFYNYGVGVLPGYSSTYRTYSSGSGSSYGSSYDQIGGLSFDIDPVDASVFIDGQYIGVAADFSSAQMPLTMAAGRHHIDLRAQGFMTVSFDITVVAGQVIPYEGSMPVIR